MILSEIIVDIIRLHRVHEMQTIVTDVRGVCHAAQGSFGAAFAESLLPLVRLTDQLRLFRPSSSFTASHCRRASQTDEHAADGQVI